MSQRKKPPIKVPTSAVVFIPPSEVWGPIQEIRRSHDRQFVRWMPHVTLLYPFWEHNEFAHAQRRLEEAGASMGAFAASVARSNSKTPIRINSGFWLGRKRRHSLDQVAFSSTRPEAF